MSQGIRASNDPAVISSPRVVGKQQNRPGSPFTKLSDAARRTDTTKAASCYASVYVKGERVLHCRGAAFEVNDDPTQRAIVWEVAVIPATIANGEITTVSGRKIRLDWYTSRRSGKAIGPRKGAWGLHGRTVAAKLNEDDLPGILDDNDGTLGKAEPLSPKQSFSQAVHSAARTKEHQLGRQIEAKLNEPSITANEMVEACRSRRGTSCYWRHVQDDFARPKPPTVPPVMTEADSKKMGPLRAVLGASIEAEEQGIDKVRNACGLCSDDHCEENCDKGDKGCALCGEARPLVTWGRVGENEHVCLRCRNRTYGPISELSAIAPLSDSRD